MRLATLKLFLLCLLLPGDVAGARVTLAWNANSEPDLAGYRLYWGHSTRNYSARVDVGNVTVATLTNLPRGTYIAATAYNLAGLESDFSNEVFFGSSNIVQISRRVMVRLESSPDLAAWINVTSWTWSAGNDVTAFYRARLEVE